MGLVLDIWKTGPPPRHGQFQQYPSRFWDCFKKVYPLEGKKILHMFSGAVDWADTTDFRPETNATFIAPYDHLPIGDGTYDVVVADPPYNAGFANRWSTHRKDLPKPKRILIEAARVTKAGGLIAIMHILLIPPWKEAHVRSIALHAILAGYNNSIRVLNVFQKLEGEQNGLH